MGTGRFTTFAGASLVIPTSASRSRRWNEGLGSGWAALAAQDIVAEPSSGVVVVSYFRGLDWVTPLKNALDQRGAELPVAGLTLGGDVLFGDDLGSFPPRAHVVVLNDITTVGTELRRMHLHLVGCGVSVGRLHALVHRGPTLPTAYDGIPYHASVHYPLSLTPPESCFECLLGRIPWPLSS